MKTTVLIFMISILISCRAEKNSYKAAIKANTIEGYEKYLTSYKNGQYSLEVSGEIDRIKFNKVRDSVFSEFIKINVDTTKFADCINIKPSKKVLMGTLVTVNLEHLPQNKTITLHAYRKNWQGLLYSFACFKTDSKGQIHLNKDKPILATYPGVDTLGVFWSMTKPTFKNEDLPFDEKNLKSNRIYFHIEVDGKIISKNELQLVLKTPDIISEEIRTKDLVANFYYPNNKQNIPLVIILGGAEGGIGTNDYAKIISCHGYAVLSLGYFGMENLPKNLERIPLEYFYHSIDWVKEKQFIDTTKIVILGGSKGGEAALLVASKRRDIKGAIALMPSSVIWQGLINGPFGYFFNKSSWALNGKDLPYLKNNFNLTEAKKFHSNPKQIELYKFYQTIFTEDKSKIEPAIIEVEKINGPIFLIAGKDDKFWPSYYMCQMIKCRLDSLNFEHQIECLFYDNAGHKICSPDLMPTISDKYQQFAVGGKDSENSAAQIDSWNKIIRFLQTYFPVDKKRE